MRRSDCKSLGNEVKETFYWIALQKSTRSYLLCVHCLFLLTETSRARRKKDSGLALQFQNRVQAWPPQ